jgi:hypothetical protein
MRRILPRAKSAEALYYLAPNAELRSRQRQISSASGRFSTAVAQAGKILEPKLQQVRLTSVTLKTPEDVKQWLSQQEDMLIEKLKLGLVIIN